MNPINYGSDNYTAKLVPQPQVLLALGLLKVNPKEFTRMFSCMLGAF